MKRSLFGLSLTLLSFAGAAQAQTSATTIAAWQAQYNATPQTTPFRIPQDMAVASPLVPGELVTAKLTPFVNDITVSKNNAYGLLFPMLAGAQINLAKGLFTPTATTTPRYPQYETDGNAATSCDEYVYKKYYDYRRFQDAAATCGGSPDCVYNLWATGGVPGEGHVMAPRSAFGGAMSPYPSSTLDPQPLQAYQSGTTQQLKNAFRDPTTVSEFLDALEDADMSTTDAATHTAFANVYNFLTSSAFTSSSPYYAISGARAPWHVQMHNQQQAYGETMADRAVIQQRTAKMQTLLVAFNEANAMDLQAAENWSAAVQRVCGGSVMRAGPCTPTNPCPVLPPPSQACINIKKQEPGRTATYNAATALANVLLAEMNNVDRVTGAIDNGCFGVGHNKCDWSPTMVGQEYLTTIDAQVATDLSTCDNLLGTAPASTLAGIQANALADEVDFGQALVADQKLASAAKAQLAWSSSAPDTIHYDLFGGPQSWSVGGSFAGANYSQSAFWEVKGEKNNGTLCRISGRVQAKANAGGSVFGKSFTMLDADLNVGVGEYAATAADFAGYDAESHMTIASYSVYNFPETVVAGNFKESLLNADYTTTLIDVQGQISWVSLDIKAQIQASVSVNLNGTAPGACSSVQNATQDTYGLGVSMTPSVSAVAVGTALVGALGTGVGLQGTVDLLTVSLPLSVSSGIGIGSDSQLDLELAANASLGLDVLAGHFDVAECVIGICATQQLYAWDGIPAYKAVLWNTNYQFPLLAMQATFK